MLLEDKPIIYKGKCYSMPMTRPEDFGREKDGGLHRAYCLHCYDEGVLIMGVSLEQLIENISKLPDMEAEHPGLVSAPLLQYIHTWLSFGDNDKLAGLSELHTKLADAQGSNHSGAHREEEPLHDGGVCHCPACMTARLCVSDIKRMNKVKRFNKLVRDKIPVIIEEQGASVRTEILMGEGYYIALKQKLTEEVGEFLADDNAEEIADVLEVLHAIARYKGIEMSDVEVIRLKKKADRGGFEEGIRLIEAEWSDPAVDDD